MFRKLFFFFTWFSFALTGLTYYLLRRRLKLGKTGNRILFSFFLLVAILMITGGSVYRRYQPDVDSFGSNLLQWSQYLLMGWLATTFLVMMISEVLQLLSKPFDPKKRIFLTEGAAKGILIGTSLATVGGLLEANAGPEVTPIQIKLPTLPPAFKGLTIAQISDIHIGPLLHRGFLDKVVDQVMALNPDIIAITGDLVDGTVEQLRHQMEPLRRLKAKDGIYFCTGNHEYYSGVEEWIKELESMGIHVFKNSNVVFTRKDASSDEKLLLGGVYDLKSYNVSNHTCDPKKAAETSENVGCKILLSHNPMGAPETADAGFDLQLSGHTHAGQFMPFTFILKMVLKYTEGHYFVNEKTQLYINRGTGYWGPPNRLGKRSEITHLTLI